MTDFDRPRPFFILALMLGAVLGFLAYRLPADNDGWIFIKFVFGVLALGSGIWGLTGLVEYMIWLWAQANESRYPIILAEKIRPLSSDGIKVWSTHTDFEMIGMMTGVGITWRLRGSPVDIDWNFAREYLELSRKTLPFLAPISQTYELMPGDTTNAERQAAALIAQLAEKGYVDPGKGNKPARLAKGILFTDILEMFGMADK